MEDTSYILHELDGLTGRDDIRFSPIGGLMTRLINNTGVESVPGQIVEASDGVNYSYELTGVNDNHSIGVVYDAVADGSKGWIVIAGIVDVLLKDNTAGTRGNWVKTSSEAGYADATLANPPGGGINPLDEHMQEIGHCLQTIAAGGGGTHQLCRILSHYN